MRAAAAASSTFACSTMRCAAARPVRRTTQGRICAATSPRRTSGAEKRAVLSQSATSAAQTKPRPPAKAPPWTRATTTCGRAAMRAKRAPVAALRATCAWSRAASSPGVPATSPRSRPAQKCPPAPSSTSTRRGGAVGLQLVEQPIHGGHHRPAHGVAPVRAVQHGAHHRAFAPHEQGFFVAHPRPPAQSIVAPVARTMGSHFSISAAMKSRVRSGVRPGIGSLPSCRSRASTSSLRSATCICS